MKKGDENESSKPTGDTEDEKTLLSRLLAAKRDDWTSEIKKIDDESVLKRILEEIDNMIEDARTPRDLIAKLGALQYRIQEHIKDQEKKEKARQARAAQRVASITVGLDTQMQQKCDLERLIERTNDLLQWHTSDKTKNEWVAPYFAIVQSSGIGKTKLMKEMTKTEYDSYFPPKTKRILILCSIGDKDLDESGVFDHVLDLSDFKGFDEITNFLNSCVRQYQEYDKVVVMFDEAQYLIRRPFQAEWEADGFLLKVIRWWIRRRYPVHKKELVAILASTSFSLTDRFPEPLAFTTSRDPVDNLYHNGGTKLVEPFYEICTHGLFSTGPHQLDLPVKNEYQRSIPFGRPLFPQLVHAEGWDDLRNKEVNILRRVLLGLPRFADLEHNTLACLSALATRVQMGETSADVARQFVADGYAYLSHYNIGTEFAQIGFPPDPVLARIVMCLMTPGYQWPSKILEEQSNLLVQDDFWANQAAWMFSSGLCWPRNGDVGEVAIALCLLMEGDRLRYDTDKTLQTFSVSLQALLTSVAGFQQGSQGGVADGGPTVSFIQVCHNHFPLHGRESILFGDTVLKRFYQAGSAFYSSSDTEGYAILAPVKYTTKSENADIDHYVPLLINCKAQTDYSASEFLEDTQKMQDLLRNAGNGPQSRPRGVCLTVLVGGLEKSRLDEFNKKLVELNGCVPGLAYENQIERVLTRGLDGSNKDGIASLVVAIPEHDRFGITKLLKQTSGKGCAIGEILQSQSLLRDAVCAMGEDGDGSDEDLVADLLLSTTPKGSDAYELTRDLKEGFGVKSDAKPT